MYEKKIFTSEKVNKDGQVTIPIEICQILNIKKNDRLQFEVQKMENGEIVVHVSKEITPDYLFGVLKTKQETANIPFDEIRKITMEEYAKNFEENFND
jgi:bifunctional DNA-binding transcriptional regulator/antitoxin component of YhaV-PrlF toxin-antitoxin module